MKTTIRIITAIAAMIAAAPAVAQDAKKAELPRLGQAAFRLTTPGGKVIMIDPWLATNPRTPEKWKNLDELAKVDLILVTHAHNDHLGNVPELAKKHNVPVWSPAGLGSSLATLGILPANLAPRIDKGGVLKPWGDAGVKITATQAEHSSSSRKTA